MLRQYDFAAFGDWTGHAILRPTFESTPLSDPTDLEWKLTGDFDEPVKYPFESLPMTSHVHPFFFIYNAGRKLRKHEEEDKEPMIDFVPKQ